MKTLDTVGRGCLDGLDEPNTRLKKLNGLREMKNIESA